MPAPSSEWIITAITRRDRSSIFADRTGSKFSAVQTRSLVIGFVTAWNRVNQIRDSINFDPTTTSLIKLYTFVYFAFVRNILIRVNFINQHHRRIFSFPVYNKNSVYTVLSYRNTKFFFDRGPWCCFFFFFLFLSLVIFTRESKEKIWFFIGERWSRYMKGRISIFPRIDINWYDEDHTWDTIRGIEIDERENELFERERERTRTRKTKRNQTWIIQTDTWPVTRYHSEWLLSVSRFPIPVASCL